MMRRDYYVDKLAADRLRRCYEIATPSVRRYMEAELRHVLNKVRTGDAVLELGCGYGRVLGPLVTRAGWVVGVDTSFASLQLASKELGGVSNCRLVLADAVRLGLGDGCFDVVVCIQNGISAFHVDQRALIEESLRVTRTGGKVLFSSYAERFWDARLDWFRLQAEHGLIGEIDDQATSDGIIGCKDGFTATTVGTEAFDALTSGLDVTTHIEEVDASSLFCEMVVGQARSPSGLGYSVSRNPVAADPRVGRRILTTLDGRQGRRPLQGFLNCHKQSWDYPRPRSGAPVCLCRCVGRLAAQEETAGMGGGALGVDADHVQGWHADERQDGCEDEPAGDRDAHRNQKSGLERGFH